VKAFILAAGFGTRLRPITYTMPKPMVPLCNRPLIAWAVESLLATGVREIIVNLHHFPTCCSAS
jgi:NDP-sugar pyrophosphorylase family protein